MLFQDPSKEKKKKKVKTKKNRGDVVNREFEKYSSGSESNEDGDEYESPPPAPEDLYDINPFKSDHEFSCESDVPDTEVQIVKHARTATKGKRKRGRPPKISKMEEESEEGKFLLFNIYYKGSYNNYVDKIFFWGGGSENVCICPRSGYETVHAGGGGDKNGKILST